MADNNSNSSSRSTTNNSTIVDNNQGVNGGSSDEAVGASTSTVTATERAYVAGNNSIKTLVVLCQGLKKDDGSDFIDIKEEQPWKSVPRGLIKPSAAMLKDEIVRRYEAFGLEGQENRPHPNAWTLEKLTTWLDKHPIEKTEDIEFLKRVTEAHKLSSHEAHAAAQIEKESLELNWTGKYPYLRLIHCVIDERIKELYLRRNDLNQGRLQVENRNSSSREKNVWEKIADLWNDGTFEPYTEDNLFELHPDFTFSVQLSYDKVRSMTPATAQKIYNVLSTMLGSLTKVIQNWEKSGQGDGGHLDEDDEDVPEFGSLEGRTPHALHCRHNFVKGSQSYLLYLWHTFDKHQLLHTSLNAFPDDVGASDGAESVPSAISTAEPSARKSKSVAEAEEGLGKIAESIAAVGNAMLQERAGAEKDRIDKKEAEIKRRLDKVFDEKRKVRRMVFDYETGPNRDERLAAFYKEDLAELERKEASIEAELSALTSTTFETPQRSNTTTPRSLEFET